MTGSAESKGEYKTILVTTKDKITKITLNRPHKKNAFNFVMYREIQQALEEAAKDDCTLTAMTGCGDYFSSGNDLSDISKNMSEIQKTNGKWLRDFIGHFIDFPKPLIALVNGHAIGLTVALLGLVDIVYASDKSWNSTRELFFFPILPCTITAYGVLNMYKTPEFTAALTEMSAVFQTQFTQLGLCPEGCSSHTFPKIMGATKANEMLMFNKKITAKEACAQGLVTEVFSDSDFQGEVWTRLKAYANLPKNGSWTPNLSKCGRKTICLLSLKTSVLISYHASLALSKQLIRSTGKEILHAVASQECDQLMKRCLADEFLNYIKGFVQMSKL